MKGSPCLSHVVRHRQRDWGGVSRGGDWRGAGGCGQIQTVDKSGGPIQTGQVSLMTAQQR